MKRTRAQVGKSSKRKGSTYELKIAKLFMSWCDREFRRTPASGGLVWYGDIQAIDDERKFPFCIECKNRQGWSFANIFEKNSSLNKFWRQCQENALKALKIPLLIFTKTYAPDYFMISQKGFGYLQEWMGDYTGEVYLMVKLKGEEDGVIVGLLKDFFDWCNPEIIFDISKNFSVRR